jgi:hypothetical protein
MLTLSPRRHRMELCCQIHDPVSVSHGYLSSVRWNKKLVGPKAGLGLRSEEKCLCLC